MGEVQSSQDPVDFHWQPGLLELLDSIWKSQVAPAPPPTAPELPPTALSYINSVLGSTEQFSSWTELRAEDGSSLALIGSAAAVRP